MVQGNHGGSIKNLQSISKGGILNRKLNYLVKEQID
jgi:hypothetical protein